MSFWWLELEQLRRPAFLPIGLAAFLPYAKYRSETIPARQADLLDTELSGGGSSCGLVTGSVFPCSMPACWFSKLISHWQGAGAYAKAPPLLRFLIRAVSPLS